MKPVISLFWSQIDVDKPNTVYLHARYVGGPPVAQLCLDLDDKAGWIRALYVQEPFRGQGLATLLMERAFAICRAHNFETVGLTVHNENEKARGIYRRMGFVGYMNAHETYQQYIKILN